MVRTVPCAVLVRQQSHRTEDCADHIALLGEAEEDERVVRAGVARFAQGAGFHLVIRPVEHFADTAADEIGDGDLRGGMDVAGERIAPMRASRLHYL